MDLDEFGLPVLPPAPRDADGRHWGMRHAIGWSNPYDCPDRALLIHALRSGRAAPMADALQIYGTDLVMLFWEYLKASEPPRTDFVDDILGALLAGGLPAAEKRIAERLAKAEERYRQKVRGQ